MGLNDGISNKKSDTHLDDEGGVSVGEVGVTTIGSTVGGDGVDDNDDLTNLTWLQDRNLLKSMTSGTSGIGDKAGARGGVGGVGVGGGEGRLGEGGRFDLLDDAAFGTDDSDSDDIDGGTYSKDNIVDFIKEENENVYPDDVCSSPEDETRTMNNNSKDDGSNLPCSVPPVPYNPKIHIHAKPPYSFSSLIFMAIESSPSKALPVKEIYAWIVEHFPYYQNSPSGWKNTVRHNLSLNKCFKKLDKGKDELVPIVGKGSLWCVDPDLRPNLLQAVRRTPAHIYPYMSTAKTNFKITPINELSSSKNRGLNDSRKILTFDQIPQIGNSPLLGKRLLIPIINRESEEADAAQSMLTLTRYNSEENRSNIKSEPSDETTLDDIVDDDGGGDDDDDDDELDEEDDDNSTIHNNPTDDHNYFSRTSETKKHNIINEAQKLVNLEITTTTRLTTITTAPSISNPSIRIIPAPISLTSTTKTYQHRHQQLTTISPTTTTTQSNLVMEKVSIDNKSIRGNLLMKRKVEVNDEDGLKGAQALLNLATRGLEVKTSTADKQDNHQLQLNQLAQSSITLPCSLSPSVKNIIDNVTNNSVDINSITQNKKRRERNRD